MFAFDTRSFYMESASQHYGIGLDIGVTSVGWAIVALDELDRPYRIIDLGVRMFDLPEDPQSGASNAAARRSFRSARRTLRRKQHRKERIRKLIIDKGILSEEELAHLFDGTLSDIYALRTKALSEPISPAEFARILIHLAQRRGFKSNRRHVSSKEDGPILATITRNIERIQERKYQTVGEMLYRDAAFSERKHNLPDQYLVNVTRDMIEEEARFIFAAQRSFSANFASEDIEKQYLEILLSQRSFDQGPASGPYSGNLIEKMIGQCTLMPEYKRAAKATYSFEYFRLLQDINTIILHTPNGKMPLDASQRQVILDLVFQKSKKADITFADIRKALELPYDSTFNLVQYSAAKDSDLTQEQIIIACEKKKTFRHMRAYHMMKQAFGSERFEKLTTEQLDTIGYGLSVYKTEENIQKYFEEKGFSKEDIDVIQTLEFSGFGHISIEACKALCPYLEQGMRYHEACDAAQLDFQANAPTTKGKERTFTLKATPTTYDSITSPAARRATSQTIKVLNAIIRRMGTSPTYVNIELAREMGKPKSERNAIAGRQNKGRAQNETAAKAIAKETGIKHPRAQDILKYRLWIDQGEVCAYSQTPIALEQLFDPNATQIDHIVPYSISFDNSYRNKVLVLTAENQQKRNRLPLQYLMGDRRDRFITYVQRFIHDPAKRRLLLLENLSDTDVQQMSERALQDTKQTETFVYNFIRKNLQFTPFHDTSRKRHVLAVNGSTTAYLRSRWGLNKNRNDGDLHHAQDALVVACTTSRMIELITLHAQAREQWDRNSDYYRYVPYPWKGFRDELGQYIPIDPDKKPSHPIFVSRMPQRSIPGSLHEASIRQAAVLDGKSGLVMRTPLTKLTLKNGEIAGYFRPEADLPLYNALKARLLEFGSAEKAFAEPFYHPCSGNPVHRVKIFEAYTNPYQVRKGFAEKGKIIRLDIFCTQNTKGKKEYYMIPVYVSDAMRGELPCRVLKYGKPESQWPIMDDKDFVFSLYKNDLIRITPKNKIKLHASGKNSTLPAQCEVAEPVCLYYASANAPQGKFDGCRTHDNSYHITGMGIQNLPLIEKLHVDVLGHVTTVKKEKRMPIQFKKKK